MAKRIIVSPQAIKDLKKISEFYRSAPIRAGEVRKNIVAGFNTLRLFPLSGILVDIRPSSSIIYRSLVVDREYKFIYTINGNDILIISVWNCLCNPIDLFDVLQEY